MDIPDWGTSLLHCQALGERAQVVLDTGHHAPGTNIEFIVMQLQRVGKLGAFDFNSRYYADDDLVVGSADPFQLFRILNEIVAVGRPSARPRGVNFMLDQCHNIEEKIPGQIRSVLNVEQALAKALLVDRDALVAAEEAGDVLGAHGVLMDAYDTDVRGRAGRPARGAGPAARPDGRLRRVGLPAAHRRRAGRRHPGVLGFLNRSLSFPLIDRLELRHAREPCPSTVEQHRRRSRRPLEPAGRRPAQHQLRRREHLREGHRDRPRHRAAGGAGVGEGLRR